MALTLSIPVRQIPLSRFGGLYTEADQRDLPIGSSPLNSDCDFLIGSTTVRPGLVSIQNFTNSGTLSTTATLDYLKGALFTWTNSVGPVTLFQADDGTFWIDYECSGNATMIYSGFLNNARMLSETFAQYEFCALGNWGNISNRALLQGVDQPRTFTVQTAIPGSGGPGSGGSSGGGGGVVTTSAAIVSLIPVRQNLVAISGQGGTVPAGNPGAGLQGVAIDLGNVPIHPNLTPNDKIRVFNAGAYNGVYTVSIIQQPGTMLVFNGPGVGLPPQNPAGAGAYVQYELVTINTSPIHYNPPPLTVNTITGAPAGYNGQWIERQNEVVPFQIVLLISGASALANGTGGTISYGSSGGGSGSGGGSTGGGGGGGGSTPTIFAIGSLIPVRQNIVAISGNGGTLQPPNPYAGQTGIAVSLGSQPVHPNLTPGMKVNITGTNYYDGPHIVAAVQNTPGSGVMSLVTGKGVGLAHIVQTGKIQYELVTVVTSPAYNPAVQSQQNVLGATPISYNGVWPVVQNEVVPNQIVLLISGASTLPNGSGGTIAAVPGASISGQSVGVQATAAGVQSVGVVSPTTTQFDRISQVAPASNNWSVTLTGNSSLTSGIGALAPGLRYAVLLYEMQNGYITPASVPVKVIEGATPSLGGFTTMQVTGIPTGPPEAINVIVAMTIPVSVPANVVLPPNAAIGGPYFWVPQTFPPSQTNSYSTVVASGTPTLTVSPTSDVVLTSGINITVPGNNLLAGHQRELGEVVKIVNYGARAWYLGERTKVDGFANLTFDGGISTDGSIGGWLSTGSYQLIPSPIYGLTLQINGGGGHLSQNATYDAFGVPILQPNVQYNARITAWSNPAGAQVGLVINGGPTVFTPPLTTTPAEYALFNLIHTGSDPANNGSLSIVTQNVPAGGIIYVDRIEVYPAVQPVYSHQLIGSYIENYQAVDAQTGVLDTSEFSYEAQTNAFRFLQSLYITTENHTFTTSTDPTNEPSGWSIQEVSNAAGCVGPAAADVGEEYVLLANRKGVYLFDGGNHVLISQEIQSLWEQIYWPSATQIWIKNDLHKYRLFVGVPMVTPNQWLPNAPPMATPTKPNVILMCSYRGDATGAEIAASPGVHVSSFTGQLLARDFTRKWSPWLINSAYGTVILKGAQAGNLAGAEQVWFGGTGNGTVWHLDPTARTDNGTNPIPQVYTTYGFADEMTSDAKQLLTTRRLYSYMTVVCEGQGGLVLTTLPSSLDTPYADVQPVVQMQPVQVDRNIPINETGDRLFLQFAPDGNPGSYFTLHRVVLGIQPDPWIPVTGSDEGEILLGKYGGSQ